MSATCTVKQRRNTCKKVKEGESHQNARKYGNKGLCHYGDLPEWQRDNDKIKSGYVRETGSFQKCLESLLYFHNETLNIYTHLIPSGTYLVLLMFFTDLVLIPKFPSTNMSDYIMINFYLLGAFLCLMCSSCFHCLKQHSEAHSDIWSKVDYMGIIVLISCSTVSLLYYGFHDYLFHFKVFTIAVVILGSCCAAFVLNDRFNAKNWRACRAAFFVLFGFSGIVPIFTGLVKFGVEESSKRVQLRFVLWEAFFYIGGAIIYGLRLPETLLPGKFDFVGHSHQIFHVLVVLGSLCHFRALIGSYFFLHTGISTSSLLNLKTI
ncbi:LANO_0A05094g1_1 [Lachancea nothofagi CBS 11611]|uniref:LANO_0A05094g1_1 n=1 Tax=Lachancea nothofagi CBS 11611 TaxID=1266666 RepID=A0A1G4IQT6_9SACH|nr:LANO_0A05094g1_1 [Lachancea nothofagi CBS 11611]